MSCGEWNAESNGNEERIGNWHNDLRFGGFIQRKDPEDHGVYVDIPEEEDREDLGGKMELDYFVAFSVEFDMHSIHRQKSQKMRHEMVVPTWIWAA